MACTQRQDTAGKIFTSVSYARGLKRRHPQLVLIYTEAESDMRVSRSRYVTYAVHVQGSRTRFMFRHACILIYGNGARSVFFLVHTPND